MNNPKAPEVLAFIPARGGSKGVPKKNILPLGGRPMIGWAIEAARTTAAISRTLVSSDSEEIMEVAKRYGAEAPFTRPADLATDAAGTWEVLTHCLDWLENQEKYVPDIVVLLQANSPFVKPRVIQDCFDLLLGSDSDVVYTVSKIEHPPHWAQSVDQSGRPDFFAPRDSIPIHTRRQDMPDLYRPTGTVSATRMDYLRECRRRSIVPGFHLPIPDQRSRVVVIDQITGLDIDTQLDYLVAQSVAMRGSA